MEVTTIQELKNSSSELVTLPSFSNDVPFVARLRRPSLMALAAKGKIPNSLLASAASLFTKNRIDDKEKTALKQLYEIIDVICEGSFVEPTYKELKDAGVELTDEQMMAVFNYSQRGVKALEPFRSISKNNATAVDGENV